ncbi:hypothetical protein [Nocardioides perillae]|uniref:Uncharacterized protein n=1 Tax=Nocardioides perillae TaxID=1119534 RepID=A0A7Y9RXS5_9ACTN|nr:hypothetical protein [Nocardioides perillae]NYG55895.1 hypothetical protein [Nocardioides perillae]
MGRRGCRAPARPATERPAPATALRLGRRAVAALLGQPLPVEAHDLEAVLVGTGRAPATGPLAALADRLPALS